MKITLSCSCVEGLCSSCAERMLVNTPRVEQRARECAVMSVFVNIIISLKSRQTEMLLSHEPTATHNAHEDSHLHFNIAVITERCIS